MNDVDESGGAAGVAVSAGVGVNEPSGWRWLYLTAAVVLLDQLTKEAILNSLVPYESIRVLPVLDITLMFNTGAAFSFLANHSGWQRWFFTAIAVVISTVIVVWLRRVKAVSQWALASGLSLILAGAVGNVFDRIRHGHVVDFVHAHWGSAYFPAFNVADASITVGAGLLILDAFLEGRRKKEADASPSG
jgi:signal peptidase II